MEGTRCKGGAFNPLLYTVPTGPPASSLGQTLPPPGLGLCCFVCWAIASRSSQAQLQLYLLQEAFRTSLGRAAVSSDKTALQMTRLLSLSRTT